MAGVTFYSAVFPFMAYAPDFFADKFGFTDVQSGWIPSLLPLGTLIFTPLFAVPGSHVAQFGQISAG